MAATLVVTFACLIPLLLPSLFAPVPTVCFRFPADFEIMKEPRTKVPASVDTDFWVVFCRDESNGRTNYPLCVVPQLFFCFNSYSAFSCFLVFFLWVLLQFSLLVLYFFPPGSVFLLSFSAPCSGFSSPFCRETCPSTSPAFAGLLFKSRTGSWARDVVHDLLQISC